MQLFHDVREKVTALAADNATTLLTAGGVVGTIATAVLTGRSSIKAYQILEAEKEKREVDPTLPELTKVHKTLMVAPHFIPPVLLGGGTVACIIMANRMNAQKAAALAAAYGMSQKHFEEYKQKVSEKLTGPKKKEISDELAQETVDKTPGSEKMVIIEGEVLCFDKPTGRYFNSTMEQIRQAVNTTNAEIFNHGFTTVNFFYEELGLPPTTWAGEVGFDGDNTLELEYTTTMAPGNRPCIAIDFRSMPKTETDGPKYG